jgi:hypothetical protein
MSSSSIFLETLFATSKHDYESLTYLIWGITLKDIISEISPSAVLTIIFLSCSVHCSRLLINPIVDGILRENIFLPTA